MESRAKDYLSHMQDLVERVPSPITLRIECMAVIGGAEGVPRVINPAEFFQPQKLFQLLYDIPLMLPFALSDIDVLEDWDPVSVQGLCWEKWLTS